MIHPGYVRMFKESKETACDQLIVLLQDDPTVDRPDKCKPVQTWEERSEILLSLRDVDEVWRYCTEAELYELLRQWADHIDVRILGSDYIGKKYTGDDLGIPVFYCSRDHEYSLTGLKRKIYRSMADRQEP